MIPIEPATYPTQAQARKARDKLLKSARGEVEIVKKAEGWVVQGWREER
jgi:hypothetical protein